MMESVLDGSFHEHCDMCAGFRRECYFDMEEPSIGVLDELFGVLKIPYGLHDIWSSPALRSYNGLLFSIFTEIDLGLTGYIYEWRTVVAFQHVIIRSQCQNRAECTDHILISPKGSDICPL